MYFDAEIAIIVGGLAATIFLASIATRRKKNTYELFERSSNVVIADIRYTVATKNHRCEIGEDKHTAETLILNDGVVLHIENHGRFPTREILREKHEAIVNKVMDGKLPLGGK